MPPSAISIIRLSGSGAKRIALEVTGIKLVPRYAHLCDIKDPLSGEALDRGLVLLFPGPNSFTGEDCAEFHLHGSRAVINAVITALSSQFECRAAKPGEFTRRAFLNGKLDLTNVESLADLIESETEAQRRQALRSMQSAA